MLLSIAVIPGYQFNSLKLLSCHPTIDSTSTHSTMFQAMGELLEGLLEKHMIEEVFKNFPGYYS